MNSQQFPTKVNLEDLAEGTPFRASFDIIQTKKDPNYYIAFPGTNKAIGRVIVPKGAVDGSTEVALQWFEEVKLPASKPKAKKKAKK